MAMNLDSYFGLHATALKLRSERAEVLANNIINADTPGFKARDIDFQSVLKDTMGDNQTSVKLQSTSGNHMALSGISDPTRIQYRTNSESSPNGNTVNVHMEKAQYTENAVRYEASLKFLDGKVKGLLSAIRGE